MWIGYASDQKQTEEVIIIILIPIFVETFITQILTIFNIYKRSPPLRKTRTSDLEDGDQQDIYVKIDLIVFHMEHKQSFK